MTTSAPPAKERFYGLDLLRLISMAMIVVHHCVTHGGLIAAFPKLSPTDLAFQFINCIAYYAVNLYGLVSGYVMCGTEPKLSRLAELWLQVVATSLAVTAAYAILGKQTTLWHWLQVFLPVTTNNYWYFTCYFGMFLLLPFLNRLLDSLSRRDFLLMLGAAVLMFCVESVVVNKDCFRLNDGYHVFWIIMLYVTGYYLRRFGFGRIGRHALLIYLSTLLISFGSGVLIKWLTARSMISGVSEAWLTRYVSPTLYFGAIAQLAIFSRLRLSGWVKRAVVFLSPLAFGVYLIHEQPLLRDTLIAKKFIPLAQLPVLSLFGLFLLIVLGIFGGCLLLEWVRHRVFALVGVRKHMERLETRVRKWLDRKLPQDVQ